MNLNIISIAAKRERERERETDRQTDRQTDRRKTDNWLTTYVELVQRSRPAAVAARRRHWWHWCRQSASGLASLPDNSRRAFTLSRQDDSCQQYRLPYSQWRSKALRGPGSTVTRGLPFPPFHFPSLPSPPLSLLFPRQAPPRAAKRSPKSS